MLFTIVTVCYNAESCIEQTIKSVLSQKRDLFEYIIIDGKSKDATMAIVDKYSDDIDIVVSEPDKGIYDAMNKAIDLAKGDYINFMNAGDCFVNSSVLKDVSTDIKGEIADVVFGNEVVKLDGIYYEMEATPFYAPPHIRHSMGFNHQCTFVRTVMARQYPFDLQYRLAADYNMIMTIYRNKGTFLKVSLPIAYFDTNGVSVRQKKRHDTEIFAIERPNKKIANYIEVQKRHVIRKIKPFIKKWVLYFFPTFMERKRALNKRFKQIKIDLI